MTKSILKSFLLLSSSFLVAQSAQALTPEFTTYLRAGSGSNGKGGVQECVSNRGSAGNEFRLGNECGIYGEFQFGAHVLKSETETGPYWKLFSDFAFSYDNRKTWENRVSVDASTPPNASHNNWVLTELYTEAGNVDGLNFSVWVGKRYFRWGDVHMMDFYPVNMSGPGGGIGNIKLGSGIFHAAIIQNGGSDEFHGNSNVSTEIGAAAKTSLHLRWEQVPTDFGNWSAWLAGATTPSTKATATGTGDYKSTTGGFLAIKNNFSLDKFYNELGVAYGHGNMSNMWSGGELVLDCATATSQACNVNNSKRIRAWEYFTIESGKLSTQLAAIYDEYDKAIAQDSKVRWMSIGVRPIYWFTDHLSLAFEGGISNVTDESDGLGARNLSRVTVAPQMSMGKGFYSRPVLRAYYTKSFWNENNKVSAAGTSAANDTSLDAFGFQTEVWF